MVWAGGNARGLRCGGFDELSRLNSGGAEPTRPHAHTLDASVAGGALTLTDALSAGVSLKRAPICWSTSCFSGGISCSSSRKSAGNDSAAAGATEACAAISAQLSTATVLEKASFHVSQIPTFSPRDADVFFRRIK